MSQPRTLDVGDLPPGAFGSRSLMWWGTLGMVVIESTVFALAIASYFYFRTRIPTWPPDGVAPPELRWGTINTLILLASVVPNELAKHAGERLDLRGVRRSAVRRSARRRGRSRRLGAYRSARASRCGRRGHDCRRLRSQDP